ncbi:DUF4190 domain-containing protein [Herbiconiux sp. 11R-BC]|uniref:DUF4190 domain-containing protein n=1 Tax=Herbiconiux sp. 11R-BC TaxID=3111637 RepID=UPI003C101E9F
MSDTNNTTPGAEPPVPPVTPPVPGYQQPPVPPAPGYPPQAQPYQQPPAAPGYYQQPPVAPGYQQAPPGYQPPPVQQPYYGYQAPATPPTNVLAIITIILAFVFSIAGIVTGHIALKQIDRTGEQGRGLAKAGLILSYVFTGLWVIGIIIYVVFLVVIFAAAGAAGTYSY